MKFILGQKLEMSQKFKEDGTVVPVTVIKAGPCYITQVKDKNKDGYYSVQIGFREAKKINKPKAGHLKDIFKAKDLKEFRIADFDSSDAGDYEKGQKITVEAFLPGEKVKVTGDSKGKGFQGVVKRHGFSGAKKTHGTKDQVRRSGSIGATGPAHVFKGTRMAGRMGGKQVSVANLEIIDIDIENNLLFIKGAIPGSRHNLIKIVAPGKMDLGKLQEKNDKKEDSDKNKDEKKDAPATLDANSEEGEKTKIPADDSAKVSSEVKSAEKNSLPTEEKEIQEAKEEKK